MKTLLERLLAEGKLRPHTTSAREVSELLRIVERDITDARLAGLSTDRKFAVSYNAVLQLATIVLNCTGYRTVGISHHFTTFEALKEIFGKDYHELIDYFDSCRSKRNLTDYNRVGMISRTEVDELLKAALKFKEIVLGWIQKTHPRFFPASQ